MSEEQWHNHISKIDELSKRLSELSEENECLHRIITRERKYLEKVESERLCYFKALGDIEKVWYNQNHSEVIKIIDNAKEWKTNEPN